VKRTLIWDVPTRLFHWTLASSFAGAWLTRASDPWLAVHVFFGYLMLGLIGFRIIWGLVGTHYARFDSFWYGPKAAITYLRQVLSGKAMRHIGHNPSGSLAIYLLLVIAMAIGLSGMLTLGSEEQHGLLAGWFDIAQGGQFKNVHEMLVNLMLALVLVHIAGVIVESLLHKENLARSMLTGIKLAGSSAQQALPRWRVAFVMLALMATFTIWWFFYALHAPLEKLLGMAEGSLGGAKVAWVGPKLADNAQWRNECGSCHLAFHPSLLPARSWQAIMDGQQQHFGSDLSLDAPTIVALLAYARLNSAEHHQTEPATKIDLSLQADSVPLRITQAPYWVKKHRRIADADWQSAQVKSKANCGACHEDAEAGTFEDGAMQVPNRTAKP
jgi:cytochrome b